MIVPNGTASDAAVEVSIPGSIGLGSTITVTDLLTEETVSAGTISSFCASVAAGSLGIYLIDDGSVLTTGREKNIHNKDVYPLQNTDLRTSITNNLIVDKSGRYMLNSAFGNDSSEPYINDFEQRQSLPAKRRCMPTSCCKKA